MIRVGALIVFFALTGLTAVKASSLELVLPMGHTGSVMSVAFSPDGRYALTGSNDNTAKLWDVSSGKGVRAFTGHAGTVYTVSFSPDGCYVLTGSGDRTAKLWEMSADREVRVFTGHASFVYSVLFSPDGRYALTGSGDRTARLWDVSSGLLVRTFTGHSSSVPAVSFSPDGRYVLTGSQDKTAKLSDVSSGREVRTFAGHVGPVDAVLFSPDGRYALTGSWDDTAKLWEVSSGEEVHTFTGHTANVYSVAFSPDGRYTLTGSADDTAKLWDVATGQLVRTFAGHTGWLTTVSFSPDGRYALTGSSDNTAKLWDVSSGQLVRTFTGHAAHWQGWSGVLSVSFSPDGRYALTGSGDAIDFTDHTDKTAKLWDVPSFAWPQVTVQAEPRPVVVQRPIPDAASPRRDPGTRVALGVGNSTYQDVPLRNPVNDAKDMAAALRNLGFDVIMELEANKRRMVEAINSFTAKARQSDAALFYFSGHGAQVNGENYLIPVQAGIVSAADIDYEAVHAGRVLRKLEEAGSQINIVILDACRNNPFRGFKSQARGFTMMDAPRGTFIAYATAPNSVAADGTGRNSPYTKHLLGAMAVRGLKIEEAFKRVLRNVEDDTGGKQTPWISSSLRGDFYFSP